MMRKETAAKIVNIYNQYGYDDFDVANVPMSDGTMRKRPDWFIVQTFRDPSEDGNGFIYNCLAQLRPAGLAAAMKVLNS